MNLATLAKNVKRLRIERRLTQEVLANKAGLSLPTIKKLEGAKSEPRMNTLRSIAGALNIRLKDLLQPVRRLDSVRFRMNKQQMRKRENILALVAQRLDEFTFLEKVLGEKDNYFFDSLRERCLAKKPIEAASLCRVQLGLNDIEPVHNVCGVLEYAGVKVLPICYASDKFFGLCVGKEDGGPAVVVNVWQKIPVERRIFSAVHEFGHLILHQGSLDVDRTEENKQEEDEANLFAGHFLLPDNGFAKEWEAVYGLSMIDRVLKVKRIFSVSYKTILRRLIDLGKADQNVYRNFNRLYKRRSGHSLGFKDEPLAIRSSEPYGLKPIDFHESRFSKLVRRAVEDDQISISRGAEILNVSIMEMKERLDDFGGVH